MYANPWGTTWGIWGTSGSMGAMMEKKMATLKKNGYPYTGKIDLFKNLAQSWNIRKTVGHEASAGLAYLAYLAMESKRVKRDRSQAQEYVKQNMKKS